VKRWVVDREPSAAQIAEIVELIRAGGLVLLPTDTIYGLHALATDPQAVERLARIKGREEGKPFIVIAASADQIESLGASVPPIVRKIWPAPLTAILPRGSGTIGTRVPKLAWLRALLSKSGPLFSTSANRGGESPISEPDELAIDLRNAIDGIVDAGKREGKASAIVDFTGDEPRLVREGDRLFTQKLRKTLRKTL
jgi:L-threonylcarbamoyladenylate synthase